MKWRRGWSCGGPGYRRLASGGLAAAVVVPLLLFAPGGGASAEQVTPAGGVSWQAGSQDSTGIVPDVVNWSASSAVAAVKAAGFVAQTFPGSIDCGPPLVQQQWPVGGTSAPLGSTVNLDISRRPRPPEPCP